MSSISSFFVPNRQQISAITQDNPAVATTTQAHGYQTGLLVRFFFPLDVGMNTLKDKVVEITVLNNTQFSFPIDTSNLDAFSPVGSVQVPEVIPVGSDGVSVLQPTDNGGNIVPEF